MVVVAATRKGRVKIRKNYTAPTTRRQILIAVGGQHWKFWRGTTTTKYTVGSRNTLVSLVPIFAFSLSITSQEVVITTQIDIHLESSASIIIIATLVFVRVFPIFPIFPIFPML